jgi:cysteine synthase A
MTGHPITRRTSADRHWVAEAIRALEADAARSADTHLHRVPLPAQWEVDLYVKDESTHPTGSLKHRLARSLFLYALCNGQMGSSTTVVEASSGSTAISEAYFARLLGLRFVAVVPVGTSPEKIRLIEQLGGTCQVVEEPAQMYEEAERIAVDADGCYLDQFTNAERATDWRGNNNIAESIFQQMSHEPFPEPEWVVVGAGTGGTAATLGRYLRYRRHATRLSVVDPEDSSYHQAWRTGDLDHCTNQASRIEGIGRPRVEPSFVPGVIDHMESVPDAASLAGMRYLSDLLGRRVGGSTGTNFVGALSLADEMGRRGRAGSIVTLICDTGDRYADTYYDDRWVAQQGLDLQPWLERIDDVLRRPRGASDARMGGVLALTGAGHAG